MPQLTKRPIFTRSESHFLPGMFVMGANVDTLMVAKALPQAREVMQSLTLVPATVDELARAKAELNAQLGKDLARPEGIARLWLDADTFGLQDRIAEGPSTIDAITPADLQRVATRLFKETPVASVVIGDAKQLQAALEPSIKVEMMGEVAPRPAKPETKPTMTVPIRKPE